jgi:hypothetical protein
MRLAIPALALFLTVASTLSGQAPSPSTHLGFTVGADRSLADFGQITSYFKVLAANSNRIKLQPLGPTTQGREMFMAILSHPDNLAKLDRYREIAQKLADPRGLQPAEIEALTHEGKTILLVTCSLHANEIGASQMAMEWAHALATSTDHRLDDVILLLVPSLNPDGLDIEVDWYRKHVGTPYEGSEPPWPYHVVAGHDNNRDWFMLNLKETQAVNRMAYRQWFPQVWLDMHQMMESDPRMFVPPYTNPASPLMHPLVHRTTDQLGTLMSLRLEEAGKAGVGYGYAFDVYWPGSSSETGYWKNTVALLTEVASCRLATPVTVQPTELGGGGKGLAENKVQVNYPNPWKGGLWRLRDIMDYERIAAEALLEGAATHRLSLLRNRAVMALDAVNKAPTGLWYTIPMDTKRQRDPMTGLRLAQLLRENGVEVKVDAEGTFWIPAAQPLARFLAEMLEPHRYPEIHPMPGAPILPPYDITAWDLPMLTGATVLKQEISPDRLQILRPLKDEDGPVGVLEDGPAKLYALLPTGNTAASCVNDLLAKGHSIQVAMAPFQVAGRSFPAGTALVAPGGNLEASARSFRQRFLALSEIPNQLVALKAPRVGLYKPWWQGAEEGWTRLVLERHGYKPEMLDPKRTQKGSLHKAFDVIVLPPLDKSLLVDGKPKAEDLEGWYWEDSPPEYRGGIGKEGSAALRAFVEDGGTLVLQGQACNLAVEDWNLPLRNPIAKLKPNEFSAPGPLLHARRLVDHPITWGIPESFELLPDGPIVLQTLAGPTSMERVVLSSYPEDANDLLASGWIKGGERLAGRANAVALSLGKGHLVLLGFDPVFRAQSEVTFRFLLNAVQWGGIEKAQ